jgi:SAM-dependent methyltransferase
MESTALPTTDHHFWLEMEPYIYSQTICENAKREVEQIIDHLGLSCTAKILDSFCGIGRHAKEFSKRRFSVTAYDIIPQVIQNNKLHNQKEGLNVEWVEANGLFFFRTQTYDVILNLFCSFGLFKDPAFDCLLIDNLSKSLKPGGYLILQAIGKEFINKWFIPRDWVLQPDETLMLTDKEFKPDLGQLIENFTLIQKNGSKKFEFSINVYSADEIIAMLKKVGFEMCEVYGGLDKQSYNGQTSCLTVIAQKAYGIKTNIIRC